MFQRGGGGFATMFKNTFQSGFLSILYSIGSKPLQIWDKKVWGKLMKWPAGWSLTCKFDPFSGSKWPHQKDHRSGHSKFCAWNCRHQRFYHLYHLPSRYRSLCWNSRRDMKFFQIQRKLLGLSFPTLSWSSRTWKSISHLRFRWIKTASLYIEKTSWLETESLCIACSLPYRFWTIKMCEGGSEHQTINPPPGEYNWSLPSTL